jgi:ankyrin repeat protein
VRAVDEEHKTTPAVWARTALARLGRKTCKAIAEFLETAERSIGNPPKLKSHHWKPLMDAAYLGDAKRVRTLLDAGTDPNVVSTTVHRYRPLHRAIEHKKTAPKTKGHEEVVKLLLERGADPHLRATFSKVTALQLAAMQESRFVPLLIKYFSPLNMFDACICAESERVAELFKGDKKLATVRDENGWTPLHYCCASGMFDVDAEHREAQVEIARMLLKAGADPMATFNYDEWPIPPLYHCCGQHDNPWVAEVLFEAGAEPYDNETVYHAADEGHDKCLALIEKYTEKEKLAEECSKCLATQAHWGRFRGAEWLLEHGADVNRIGRHGDAALHSAVKHRAGDAVFKLLHRYGADPKRKNAEGKTAMQLARASGVDRIVKLF